MQLLVNLVSPLSSHLQCKKKQDQLPRFQKKDGAMACPCRHLASVKDESPLLNKLNKRYPSTSTSCVPSAASCACIISRQGMAWWQSWKQLPLETLYTQALFTHSLHICNASRNKINYQAFKKNDEARACPFDPSCRL